jgi:hypothetical protein
VAWSRAGGDFASQLLSVNPDVSGPGDKSWNITKAAQAWVDGEPNLGVLIKHVDEAAGAHAYFTSSDTKLPYRNGGVGAKRGLGAAASSSGR